MPACCRLRPFGSLAAVASRAPTPSSNKATHYLDYRHLLRSCKDIHSLLQIHARLVVLGAASDDSIGALLLNSYSTFHQSDPAFSVFKSSPNSTVILWNSMIRCYTRTGEHNKAIQFYNDMVGRGIEPDKYTFTFLLKACTGALDSDTGILVHREIVGRGLQKDVFIGTGLVDMYSKLGMIDTAREVFESMQVLDVVSWNAMIAGLSQTGDPHEALAYFRKMQLVGEVPNSVTVLNLFPAVCELSALLLCRAVHGFVIRKHLLPSVFNGLIDTYCKCGRTDIARKVFDGMSSFKDDVSWGTIISGYVHNGCFLEALELFDELTRENLKLNQVSVVSALSAAAEIGDLGRGIEIHNYAIKKESHLDIAVNTMLMTTYARCGELEMAKSLFDGIQGKDIVAWSAMIAAFVQTGHPNEAVNLFREMLLAGIIPNSVTLVSLLPACADLLNLKLGRSIHCYALKSKINVSVTVATALVAVYAQCGSFSSAHILFDALDPKDVVTWNALINGYAQMGEAGKALQMFYQLRSLGQQPDPGTIVGVLPACALLSCLDEGACIHGLVIRNGFDSDLHVKNAIIDMYAKFGDIYSAKILFSETKLYNDVITWNTVITGYMHNGLASEAISTFHLMRAENLKPNFVTLVSVIPAASYLASLREGMALHSYVIRIGFESHLLVANSLIDMYSKCGRLDYARDFFNQMDNRDTVTWNVMLAGYAIHGLGENAISLFSLMKDNCIKADSVSFISILSACRHGGLIAEGRKIFESMKSENQVEPNLEHYACMVDLLGRAGELDEAWGLIQRMPMTPDAGIWGALLGACRMHSNVWMGEIAVDHLVRLEPENAAHYVVLANIYSQAGRWADARKVRVAMNHTGLNKTPGCSWVEINNAIHAFRAGDQSHPQYKSMCDVWNGLFEKMEKMGYVPDTSSVLHNVEEEEKLSFLHGHSERLAISFALLNTEPGMTIQIIKNLRVCGDCHTVTKLVSKITNHKIIVRDSSRFHHFEDGICSCKDYW
ncbi:pentatricopeptide repeat-containing protein At2g39620 [Elaeis guineensis]|uniref:Pentatricopeptide repeat-containing protein At2g39620 n=1 Tax=Elaeis guineensis var. tenera TaxID=51953 RepID=A0A6I9RAM8_ELAGV|nr:pentatricopeptide repeat-containing protein At2g39620 [Elaeis guineensis]XP_029120712.1 pentatricopeptide repeat-containing protein At2g39620 [Elaeis guineensis]